MAGSFVERIDELAEKVGHGDLVGRDTVNQYYAIY